MHKEQLSHLRNKVVTAKVRHPDAPPNSTGQWHVTQADSGD